MAAPPPHNPSHPFNTSGEEIVDGDSASMTAEDVALGSTDLSEERAELAPATEAGPESEAFSIDEVMRDAERLVQEEAEARAAAATPVEAPNAELEAHAESIAQSVAQTVAAAAVAEDEFSLDDLQGAIDEVLKEAEAKKTTKDAARLAVPSTHEDAPPAPAASPAEAAESDDEFADPASIMAAEEAVAAATRAAEEAGTGTEAAPGEGEVEGLDASDDEFAAPEALIAAERPAVAPVESPSGAVADLDSELAAKGRAALDAEDADETVRHAPPHAAPAPAAAETVSGPAATRPNQPTPLAGPSGSPSSSATAPPASPPPQAAAAVGAPHADAPVASTGMPARALGIVRRAGIRTVRAAAARYGAIGEGTRKIVKLSAWGTMAQAAIVWVWVLFIRSPDLPTPPGHAHEPAAAHAADDGHGAKKDSHAPAKKDSHGAAAKDDAHGAGKKTDAHTPSKKSPRPTKPPLPTKKGATKKAAEKPSGGGGH